MKKFKLLTAIILVFGASSCAFHSGMMNDSASLHGQDFELIGMAVGQAKTTQILGIGGLDPDGLVLEAKRELYARFPLTKGQAYANISVDFKRSYFPIVNTTKATVSADIVQFGEEKSDELQKLFKNKLSMYYVRANNDTLDLGIVINQDLKPVKTLDVSKKGEHTVITYDGKIYENISQVLLYNMKFGYKVEPFNVAVGDVVTFNFSATTVKSGMVIGAAGQTLAIRTDSKTYQVHGSAVIEVVE
jgi:hypothetical protein